VLEGSVRKSGDQVRITAQLIRAVDGYHVWSETWDRKLDDIFKIQDEIAGEVVKELRVTLLGAAPKARATDPRAYALELEARQLARQGTSRSIDEAIAARRQALAIDPGYVDAWSGIAGLYMSQANKGLKPIDESFALARAAVNSALQIDANDVGALLMLGRIATDYDNDSATAARHIERALALEPGNIAAISIASGLEQNLGRLEQAARLDQYAVERDPLNPKTHGSLAYDYARLGRLDEAISSYRIALRLSPGRVGTAYNVGELLLRKGEAAAALAEFEQESEENWRLMGSTMALHALGRKAESDTAMGELIAKYETDSSYNIAYVAAFRGERDRAFEWLKKAVAYHDTGLVEVGTDPMFASLHDDPRWQPFLREIGRAPEQLAAIEFNVTLPQSAETATSAGGQAKAGSTSGDSR